MYENPFTKRAAEFATDDGEFLDLFAAGSLDAMKDAGQRLWQLPVLLESTPGGGKTTLMRLFTPSALRLLGKAHKDSPRYPARKRAEAIGALTRSGGANVLGLYVQCAKGYEVLRHTSVSPAGFLKLLDLRILLSALHGALELFGARFPEDLNDLKISFGSTEEPLGQRLRESLGTTGLETYRSLAREEETLLAAASDRASVSGHSRLLSTDLLAEVRWTFRGKTEKWRSVLFLDDVHALDPSYWEVLRNLIGARAYRVPVWFGIRSQTFDLDELFSGAAWHGLEEGRDYAHLILDRDRRDSAFAKLAREVVEKRIRRASPQVSSKGTSLTSFVLSDMENDRLRLLGTDVLTRVRDRCAQIVATEPRLAGASSALETIDAKSPTAVLVLRHMLIWLEREARRKQVTLFDDSENELEKVLAKSEVRNAAELFLASEEGLPYYCGSEQVERLASRNVEQLLRVAGGLFGRAVSNIELRRDYLLSFRDQDTIVRQTAADVWDAIPRRVPRGDQLQRFLGLVGDFCKSRTYEPNAPYAPGVTGIAVTAPDYQQLLDARRDGSTRVSNIAEMIRLGVAFNLFEASRRPVRSKGRDVYVLYLNRLLCVRFDLPLGYGGFKEQTIDTLRQWTLGRETWKSKDRLF